MVVAIHNYSKLYIHHIPQRPIAAKVPIQARKDGGTRSWIYS